MPEDQGQLRDLLALLAQFQKSGLASGRLHQLRYPFQDASVLVGHAGIRCLNVVCGPSGNGIVAGYARAIVGRELLVVLSLGSRLDSLGLLLGV